MSDETKPAGEHVLLAHPGAKAMLLWVESDSVRIMGRYVEVIAWRVRGMIAEAVLLEEVYPNQMLIFPKPEGGYTSPYVGHFWTIQEAEDYLLAEYKKSENIP